MASTWAREEGRKEWNEADRTVTKRVFIVGNLISVFLLWLCNLDLFFQGMWRSLSSSLVLAYIQNQEDNPSRGQETAMYSLKWRCMLWWADLDVDWRWWWVALASSRSIPFRSVPFVSPKATYSTNGRILVFFWGILCISGYYQETEGHGLFAMHCKCWIFQDFSFFPPPVDLYLLKRHWADQ